MSSTLTFAHPEWLPLLLIALLLLIGKGWADHRGRRTLEAFTAPRLRQQLVAGVSPLRSWSAFLLQLAAFCLLILAACGPRWGEEEQPQIETGRNVLIAIDCSRSMLADDLAPDRLTRAKLAAQDLLDLLPGDRVGLIVFAGNAYLQAPLTTDHAAVAESIQSVDTFSVPRGGSEIGRALKLAMETFEKSPARNHGLVLFSDGGEPDPETAEWSQRAADKNILILAVGVGTKTGSLIPDPDPNRAGDFVRDEQGNAVQTALDENVLREVARATGGRYLPLGGQSIDSSLVNQVLAALERREGESKSTTKPIERFHWPLSLAIVFLVMAWLLRPTSKRAFAAPAPAALALVILTGLALFSPVSQPAQAASLSSFIPDWSNPATRTVREARRAIEREDYEGAMKLYQESLEKKPNPDQVPAIALSLGQAARQAQQYDTAVSAFSRALENTGQEVRLGAHRGLGHALYEQGDRALAKQPRFTIRAWTDSVRHLNAALQLAPDNKELIENRDFVQKRLDELQEQQRQQQQQQQGQQGQKKQGQQGQKGDQGQQGQEGDQGQQGQDGQQPGGKEGEEGEEGEGGSGDQQQQKGQGGEQEEGQKPGELPEGDITTDGPNPGDQEGEGQAREGEMGENERREDTGFSPNEARAFLRTYADDQKAVQFSRQRQQAVKGKDW